MSNILYTVKKKTCLGVLDIEEIRDNETGLKLKLQDSSLCIYLPTKNIAQHRER